MEEPTEIIVNEYYCNVRLALELCDRVENSRKEIKDLVHFGFFKECEEFWESIGVKVDYHKTATEYPALAEAHRHVNYNGLECHIEISPRDIEWQFYQNVTKGENSCGGEYDINKQSYMTYLMRKRLQLTIRKLCEYLLSKFPNATIVRGDELLNASAEQKILLDYKKSWHHTTVNSLQDIIDGKDANSGHKSTYNNTDADKKTIKNGDVKYFYYRKHLMRGRVFHNINNMWWVMVNDTELHNKACFELFDYSGQPLKQDTRKKQLAVLDCIIEKAIKFGDYKKMKRYNKTRSRIINTF